MISDDISEEMISEEQVFCHAVLLTSVTDAALI